MKEPKFPEGEFLTKEFIEDLLAWLDSLPSKEERSEEFMSGFNNAIDIIFNYVQAYPFFKEK